MFGSMLYIFVGSEEIPVSRERLLGMSFLFFFFLMGMYVLHVHMCVGALCGVAHVSICVGKEA